MKKAHIILVLICTTSFAQIGHDGGDYLYEIDEGPPSTKGIIILLIVVAIFLYFNRKK